MAFFRGEEGSVSFDNGTGTVGAIASTTAWTLDVTKDTLDVTAHGDTSRKNVARSSGGLTRWFKENWVDVKTGKPCGRSKGEKRGYPACRPKNRVSSKTPKTVGEMSAAEKARFKREKTGSKKISYQHRRKKKKK